jgi:non-homologous end joining protein Ku
MRRIKEKIRKRQTRVLTPAAEPEEEARPSAEVIDLMAVLQQSLKSRGNRGRRKAA